MTTSTNGTNDIPGNVAKAFEDINAAVANYVSAVTKSSAALWQGIEEITRNVSGLSQENFARAINAYTSMASAKNPQDALTTQTEFVKESFDNAVANGSKVSELSARVAKDAMDPLTQHANETINSVLNRVKQPL
ncbi:MAG: phasin family protein [Alphaproteobacteria bacterium]|nr:phasin family protein [Alphaproteobacteria bacterium]